MDYKIDLAANVLNYKKDSFGVYCDFFCIGNESCPQPQTSEHLAAIEIMKLKHILILQNKIDLVKEGQAKEQHEQIVKFVQGTVAEGAPIIPISAQLKYNIEVLFNEMRRGARIILVTFAGTVRVHNEEDPGANA